MSERPLSDYVKQGWEVVSHSTATGDSGMTEHAFLLRRQAQHKVLRVRKKMMGGGLHTEELDV